MQPAVGGSESFITVVQKAIRPELFHRCHWKIEGSVLPSSELEPYWKSGGDKWSSWCRDHCDDTEAGGGPRCILREDDETILDQTLPWNDHLQSLWDLWVIVEISNVDISVCCSSDSLARLKLWKSTDYMCLVTWTTWKYHTQLFKCALRCIAAR